MFINPSVVEMIYIDGVFLAGWMGLIYIFVRVDKRLGIIKYFVVLNLAFIILAIDEANFHTWHNYPFSHWLAYLWFICYPK